MDPPPLPPLPPFVETKISFDSRFVLVLVPPAGVELPLDCAAGTVLVGCPLPCDGVDAGATLLLLFIVGVPRLYCCRVGVVEVPVVVVVVVVVVKVVVGVVWLLPVGERGVGVVGRYQPLYLFCVLGVGDGTGNVTTL